MKILSCLSSDWSFFELRKSSKWDVKWKWGRAVKASKTFETRMIVENNGSVCSFLSFWKFGAKECHWNFHMFCNICFYERNIEDLTDIPNDIWKSCYQIMKQIVSCNRLCLVSWIFEVLSILISWPLLFNDWQYNKL